MAGLPPAPAQAPAVAADRRPDRRLQRHGSGQVRRRGAQAARPGGQSPDPGGVLGARGAGAGVRRLHQVRLDRRLHRVLLGPSQRGARAGLGHHLRPAAVAVAGAGDRRLPAGVRRADRAADRPPAPPRPGDPGPWPARVRPAVPATDAAAAAGRGGVSRRGLRADALRGAGPSPRRLLHQRDAGRNAHRSGSRRRRRPVRAGGAGVAVRQRPRRELLPHQAAAGRHLPGGGAGVLDRPRRAQPAAVDDGGLWGRAAPGGGRRRRAADELPRQLQAGRGHRGQGGRDRRREDPVERGPLPLAAGADGAAPAAGRLHRALRDGAVAPRLWALPGRSAGCGGGNGLPAGAQHADGTAADGETGAADPARTSPTPSTCTRP